MHSHDGSSHWIRQADQPRNTVDERVYQISKLAPGHEPLVIASCGKSSAQKLIAALATQEGQAQYRVTATFVNPCLPGLQHPDMHPGWYAARQAEQRQGVER